MNFKKNLNVILIKIFNQKNIPFKRGVQPEKYQEGHVVFMDSGGVITAILELDGSIFDSNGYKEELIKYLKEINYLNGCNIAQDLILKDKKWERYFLTNELYSTGFYNHNYVYVVETRNDKDYIYILTTYKYEGSKGVFELKDTYFMDSIIINGDDIPLTSIEPKSDFDITLLIKIFKRAINISMTEYVVAGFAGLPATDSTLIKIKSKVDTLLFIECENQKQDYFLYIKYDFSLDIENKTLILNSILYKDKPINRMKPRQINLDTIIIV